MSAIRLGFGCAGLMREPSRLARQRLLATAFEHGIRHFDVARMYGLGAAEAEVGRFIAGLPREQVAIATKFGIEASAMSGRLAALQAPARRLLAKSPALRRLVKRRSDALHTPHRYDVATARASLHTSLRQLGTDYVDLFLIHGPSPGDEIDLPEICAFLEDSKQAGLIRAWGVAGEHDTCIQLRRKLPAPATLQLQYDVFDGERIAGLEQPLIAFGVLDGALGRLTAQLGQSPEELARMLLRDALAANPDGLVLFSTTRPQRIGQAAALAATAGTQDSAELAAFREMVKGSAVAN